MIVKPLGRGGLPGSDVVRSFRSEFLVLDLLKAMKSRLTRRPETHSQVKRGVEKTDS